MTAATQAPKSPVVFGHPAGLFTLFFAEMWERFSYYGMRALLVFYMVKGFLGYNDSQAYDVYGAYTALVYATPFIGGILADRLLGARRAVVIGGLLMAAGHLLMTVEQPTAFFTALALLIVGNGFFKPNISTIVGSLYPQGSPKRDAGFTIFYMGINLGAAMSPLVCGYIGQVYGWHYGFGLATIGMLIGIAIFVAPTRLAQAMILMGAAGTATELLVFYKSEDQFYVQAFVATALLIAGIISITALNRGGLPDDVGHPKDPGKLKMPFLGPLSPLVTVYIGIVISIPILVLLVQRNTIAGYALSGFGFIALTMIITNALKSTRVERDRLFVVIVLLFFNMLFWAFFEQAGSSVTLFTDRNVDRVREHSLTVSEADVGKPLELEATQLQIGFKLPIGTATTARAVMDKYDAKKKAAFESAKQAEADGHSGSVASLEKAIADEEATLGPLSVESLVAGQRTWTIDLLDTLRSVENERATAERLGEATHTRLGTKALTTLTITASTAQVGMMIGSSELPASLFQSANPIYIILFGLLFSALWTWLGARGWDPSIPVKFSLGLAQLGLGFLALYAAASAPDGRGMVTIAWLLLGYLLHTTGELCLSPVGLSAVTKLAPERMVSTVMGAWFLATAFSNYLAAIIAGFTGVGHGSGGGGGLSIPLPTETASLYGSVFGNIGVVAIGSAVVLLLITPLLKKWMHGVN